MPHGISGTKIPSKDNAMTTVSDPRFELNPMEAADVPPRRSKWTTCLIGCLGMLGVVMLLVIAAAVWVGRNWRGWAADFGSRAVTQAVASSDLPPQEKVKVQAQVDRVTKGFRDGKLSNVQVSKIMQGVFDSPLLPAFAVIAVDNRYLERSGLSDQEKAEGRKTLKRFVRGMVDHKFNQATIDAVMTNIADRGPNNQWELRAAG